jgi:glycosyltransferase involved in cell wall biosynthesis
MRLIVDGVFFQFRRRTGIARVWQSILQRMAHDRHLEIALLDRGGCPPLDGIEVVPFPSYTSSNTAADSFLIDELCHELRADVFTSTYYTTPVSVPAVLVVYDMIPEIVGFDLSARAWQEKQIAISFASYYACISENTQSDLLKVYTAIDRARTVVAPCGVDVDVFRPRDAEAVATFRDRLKIMKPYYMVLGLREGYKNVSLLFRAARQMKDTALEILCVGGEPEIPADLMARLPANVAARRLDLSDDDLACAYAGAEALIYPSLYEGFGLPVIEAMACGCPVITTQHGSLKEIAGDAAHFISGRDEEELRRAMTAVRDSKCRRRLIESGIRRAAGYDWNVTARGIYELLRKASDERGSPAMQRFLSEWKRLRMIQAEVDTS